jgi:2-dehydro-3-deoxyphosphogluconate aldolase / (4S)-4-hydroxy-2-oxoglutarate aldolase
MAVKPVKFTDIREIMYLSPVISVLTIERLEDAVPLAQALVRGGLPVMEVALRTPCALAAISAIRVGVSEAIVGAGTITRPRHFQESRAAGAQFGGIPGLAPVLVACSLDAGFPVLPGIMSPAELIAARVAGFMACKLFPAEQAGGVGMVKALARPFPDQLFCPAGGVTRIKAVEYLAQKSVPCVSGSWVAPATAIAAKDWDAIEALAKDAAALRDAKQSA